jgi:hypothetical protein
MDVAALETTMEVPIPATDESNGTSQTHHGRHRRRHQYILDDVTRQEL